MRFMRACNRKARCERTARPPQHETPHHQVCSCATPIAQLWIPWVVNLTGCLRLLWVLRQCGQPRSPTPGRHDGLRFFLA